MKTFDVWLTEQDYAETTVKVTAQVAQRLGRLVGQPVETVPQQYKFGARLLLDWADAVGANLPSADRLWIEAFIHHKPPEARVRRRRKKTRQRQARSLTVTEFQALYEKAYWDKSQEARVVEIMCLTGMRVGDVIRIERPRLVVALETGTLYDAQVKGKKLNLTVAGADESWRRLLAQWKPGSAPVMLNWLAPRAKKSAYEAAYRRISKATKRLAAEAGIVGDVYTHRIRRTKAVQALLATGGNIKAVQDLLGHSSMKTTLTYLDEAKPDQVAELQHKLRELYLPEVGQ